MTEPSPAEVVFFAALEEGTPAGRAAYLDEACAGDEGLRRRVDALLAAHARTGRFMERPVVEAEGVAALGRAEAAPDLSFLTPPARPDSLGRLGQYEVLQVLGVGGFGVVLRAFDEVLQRVVAVKVLAPHLAATSPARKRFIREARAAAGVRHENVVQVYAVGEHPLPHLAMEFVPGETLQRRLDQTGPLEAAEVVRVGRQVAEGLAAAHATGLVHRDVKPGNILLEAGPGGRVKITDFGLARAADDASLSQSGTIAGTPLFMAPEQAHGAPLDHRADLFALGSVLYTMCSGRPPFRAPSTLAVLRRVAEDTPRPIPEIIPEAPLWLCDVITRLHEKKPADRIGTAREVADLLARGPAGPPHPGSPRPTTVGPGPLAGADRAGRSRSRARRWAAAAAATLVLAGFGLAEAGGVTAVRGTVVRLLFPEGTLVVEADDPGVSVHVDGSDLVVTGAGVREIRLRAGTHEVEARKDGRVVSRELVTVTNNGRRVVRISQEPAPPAPTTAAPGGTPPDPKAADAAAWERGVAALPAAERLAAVGARLRELNPGYSGQTRLPGSDEIDVWVGGPDLRDISPVRALPGLRVLRIEGRNVTDLSPLRGMGLTRLDLFNTGVSDLSPLRAMTTLRNLDVSGAPNLTDLSPLKGLPLEMLTVMATRVSDLGPLRGTQLGMLNCSWSRVSDLSPLAGSHIRALNCEGLKVGDAELAPLAGCKHLTGLNLKKTKVTAAGLDGLKAALPRCRVEWDGGVLEPSAAAPPAAP